jgi:hypothetical protein
LNFTNTILKSITYTKMASLLTTPLRVSSAPIFFITKLVRVFLGVVGDGDT